MIPKHIEEKINDRVDELIKQPYSQRLVKSFCRFVYYSLAQAELEAKDKELRIALKGVGDINEYLQQTNQAKVGDSCIVTALDLLKAKDKEIERLTGLLEKQVELTVDPLFVFPQARKKIWQEFKQQHNIP